MLRKRKSSVPVEGSNVERWDSAIDQIDNIVNKKNRQLPRAHYEQGYIKSCIVLAQCLILSVKGMVSNKIKVIHVDYFIKHVSDVFQRIKTNKRESLNDKLNSELFNCLQALFSELIVKSQKSLAERQLQNQLKAILQNQQLLLGALQLTPFVLPKEEVPVPIVVMRSHILQQPLNTIVEEFFNACVPTISLQDIVMKRQATFTRVKNVGIENDTANMQIVYSNSNVAKLLSQIPELISNSTQFKTGLEYLNELAAHLEKFTPLELAQFYFLSARAAFMQGSTKKAIESFQKALNVPGTHIGHHFTITANLLCAIQQYAFEISNAQEAMLVKESIQLKMSGSKTNKLTHLLRRDQKAALLSDISPETANRLFQPKQHSTNQRLKRGVKEDLLEMLKVNLTHYINASLLVCNCDLLIINSFINSIRNVAIFESSRQPRLT